MIEIDNILDAENYIEGMEAVIFDLDDTLYSEKQYVHSGYRKIAGYFGIPEMEDEMWNVFEVGGQAIDEVLRKYGLNGQKDTALQIYRFQNPEICLYPGVSEMLDRIRDSKKLGIITDGRPEGQRAKMNALGLSCDCAIVTDELGGIEFRKPNPRAFEMMSKMFDTAYDKMCYVGDNIRKDFIAPEQKGMRCIWFRNQDGLK